MVQQANDVNSRIRLCIWRSGYRRLLRISARHFSRRGGLDNHRHAVLVDSSGKFVWPSICVFDQLGDLLIQSGACLTDRAARE